MSRFATPSWKWLAVAIFVHLAISIVHGSAHTGAHVPLSPAANLFVYVVILAGPLVGLALTWPTPEAGGYLIALTMGGSLVFGVVNHFVLSSPDHVAQVEAQWQPVFATTAVLLAATEALGASLAIRFVRERRKP